LFDFPLSLEANLPLWLCFIIVAVYLAIVIITAETLNRVITSDSELTRKVVHIGTGNVILFAWGLNIPAWVGIGASVIASIVALISYFIPILPSINSVKRPSLGTFFYAITIGVLITWFWPIHHPEYAALGILIMAWGDGMAAIIGQRWGKHSYTIGNIKKSWEGSLSMAFFSFLVSFIIILTVQKNLGQALLISLAVAMLATTLEAFSKLGIDNLTVPIGSAALAFFLTQSLS